MNSKRFSDLDMEVVIGKILKYGVYISISITFLGALLYIYRHGNEPILSMKDFSKFTPQDEGFFTYILNVIKGISQGHGRSIMSLGIVILLITPTVRLIFSLIGFLIEKDRMYVLITIIVLAIITLSILGDLG